MSESDRAQIESLSYEDCVKYMGKLYNRYDRRRNHRYFDRILEDGYKKFHPRKRCNRYNKIPS